jgi:hypothetical protein
MNRTGNKWTVNEVLSLQREFQLLGLDIDQIAKNHKRTPKAIMYKLDAEGFADYNVLYNNYHNLNTKMPVKGTSNAMELEPSLDDSDNDDEADDNQDEDYIDNGEEDEDDDDDEDDDEDPLTKRVAKLESGLNEIKNMLKTLIKQQTTTNSSLGF